MNRDETVALLLRCEAEGSAARDAAVADGKPEYEIDNVIRRAARAHWEDWASKELAKRKALIDAGKWNDRDARKWYRKGVQWGEETLDWLESAVVDLSDCHIFRSDDNLIIRFRREEQHEEIILKYFQVFGRLTFPSAVIFDRSTIYCDMSFGHSVFQNKASFRDVIFKSEAEFQESKFRGEAIFESVIFDGEGNFRWAIFAKDANFSNATFSRQADFYYTKVYGDANFSEVNFCRDALFSSSVFFKGIYFYRAKFSGLVDFNSTAISGNAEFEGHTFGQVFFKNAKLGPNGKTNFRLVNFNRVAEFDGAIFQGETSFNAVRGDQAFSMANARFETLPDFTQAHFEEAPRLDNVEVKGTLLSQRSSTVAFETFGPPLPLHRRLRSAVESHLWEIKYSIKTRVSKENPRRDMAACWRALKRIAIQGHDTDRELAFFSGEVRSARFAGDWPAPWPIWKPVVWGGFFRFWSGLLYEFFSDFGRSILRPFLAWSIGILAFAAFYLSQTEVMQRDFAFQDVSYVSAALDAGRFALSNTVPCYPPPPSYAETWRTKWGWWGKPKTMQASSSNETLISGLSEKLRAQTNARAEALHLAFRNAFVVLDGGSDASHRMYGCLYGLELYAGQNPVPIVPSAVSTASAIQKLISGVLIFLFGLALRNMLKVK